MNTLKRIIATMLAGYTVASLAGSVMVYNGFMVEELHNSPLTIVELSGGVVGGLNGYGYHDGISDTGEYRAFKRGDVGQVVNTLFIYSPLFDEKIRIDFI